MMVVDKRRDRRNGGRTFVREQEKPSSRACFGAAVLRE